MIHFNNEIPSSLSIKRNLKTKESPMVLAHFNKGELATLDKLQGGRSIHKELGIPHYKKLKPLFDDPHILQSLGSMHQRSMHAAGGAIKHMEKVKAGMGRMGDTVRAAIPRNMANFMDKLGLSTKNPYTKDREYALGSNFISSLGSYLPSMGTLNPFGGGAGADATSTSAPAASTTAPSTSTPSTPAGTGGSSIMGSLFNSLAPAVVNAGANYLTGNKGSSPTGPSTSTTPTDSAVAPAPATANKSAPKPNTASGSGGQGNFGGYDPNASMMQQMQQILMQHGQNYLGSRNDPYSQFANQMMGRYNQGGAQGLRGSFPQAGYDFANQMMGNRMPQFNFSPYSPQGDMGGYGPQSYPMNNGGSGYDEGGDYSAPSYGKPNSMPSAKPRRMPVKKTSAKYR